MPLSTKPSGWERPASRRFMRAKMGEALAQRARQGFRGALTILCATGITALAAMAVASAKPSVAQCGAVK
jgi:hypothetical protein